MKMAHRINLNLTQPGKRNDYHKMLKPVFIDMHLELHEKLVQNVGKALNHTKKRLHEAELVNEIL